MSRRGLVLLACSVCASPRPQPIQFRDIAPQSGITAVLRCGGPEKQWIPEANGSGTAWLDYDNDGLLDLLIVNGSTMEDLRRIVVGEIPPPRPRQRLPL